ncbi:MAG: polyribonucleotide nucleotidyltransferase [Patescibacteria group bacterium]
MDKKIISKSADIGGKKVTLEVGRLAQQANAAVIGRCGDTMVLAAISNSKPREDLDYFPLSVEYSERFYASGTIKGSRWVKRDGRPSDDAILTSRLIDRSIRPLFPKEFKQEVQVVVTVLSIDHENDPKILAMIATSAALAISDLPWNGPVGSVRVGIGEKDQFVVNPLNSDLGKSSLDLVISGLKGKSLMLEGEALQVPEETLVKAVEAGQAGIDKVIKLINELSDEVGKKKQEIIFEKANVELSQKIEKDIASEIDIILKGMSKNEGREALDELKASLIEKYEDEDSAEIKDIVDNFLKKTIREKALTTKKRIDGRDFDEVREISTDPGFLPRTHGSAVFKRGTTQALSVVTLGSPALSQLIETMEGEEDKRYFHHYNFPPYSVGETGRIGYPSRREIGHGALAERALVPVLPDKSEFPYTIMVVSEVVSSNGSTSMASTCGSTLSLMDAGVPIKAPVSGIAMGLIEEGDKRVILTDIAGIEDFNGDMDFKLTGTKTGITAIQMDVKNDGIDTSLLKEIVKKAKIGRLFILDKMLEKLASPRKELSRFAPKIETISIPVDKIGDLIGPGGKTIKALIKETGCEINVDDDGLVSVTGLDKEAVTMTLGKIDDLTRDVEVGEIYDGEVERIESFGAFVSVLPGKSGLVHVSNMSSDFVKDPKEVVKVGDRVRVKVFEIDEMGRVNLTMNLDSNPLEDKNRQDKRFSQKISYPKRRGNFSPSKRR